MSSLRLTATSAQQREASPAGQAAGPLKGARPPRSHLLPDGPDAGYPGGLPAQPAVPLPGSSSSLNFSHQPLNLPEASGTSQ